MAATVGSNLVMTPIFPRDGVLVIQWIMDICHCLWDGWLQVVICHIQEKETKKKSQRSLSKGKREL